MKTAALLFFLCFSLFAYSQQYNNWVFGYGIGVSFNNPASPAGFIGPALHAPEGSASISDENGNLLFYTDGQMVYNRLHEIMVNGSGFLGHPSAFQSSVIVQQPNSDSLYYVFTNDALEHNFANGYRYHVVNIKAANGLGAVIQKNILLAPDATERLTAVQHANGVDVWIIGNGTSSNKFYAWLLTCTGVNAPVISTVGDVLNQHDRMNIGTLKISPNGKLLCQTHFPDDIGNIIKNFFQLFDFDNVTGTINNTRKVSFDSMDVYTCEFSPNSSLLYFTDPISKTIAQVKTTGSVADILSSFRTLRADYGFYGMQLAPDGKIYLVNSSNRLSAIYNADVPSPGSLFTKNVVSLPGTSGIGLPFFLPDLEPDPNGFTFQIIDSCTGLVQFKGFASAVAQVQWEWDFGDGSFSTLPNPQHQFASAGKQYTVRLKIKPANVCGFIQKTKQVAPGGYLADAAFNYSVQCDSLFVKLSNTSTYSANSTFYWDFGDGTTSGTENPTHLYASSGTYTVQLKVLAPLNCISGFASKTVVVERPKVVVQASQTTVTETQTLYLSVVGNYRSIRWSPAETVSMPQSFRTPATPYQDIVYYARVTNTAGCIGIDSIQIHVTSLKDIYVPSGFSPNGDGKNDDFIPALGHDFNLTSFSVFNRWGVKVFETRAKGMGWDGTYNGLPQATGSFVWVLQATGPGGKSVTKKGVVTLIRQTAYTFLNAQNKKAGPSSC